MKTAYSKYSGVSKTLEVCRGDGLVFEQVEWQIQEQCGPPTDQHLQTFEATDNPPYELISDPSIFNLIGLTQLVGVWGYLGGRSPPKYPPNSLNCVTPP